MPLSRYAFTRTIEGTYKSSGRVSSKIYKAVENGFIDCHVLVLEEGQRIETIAGLSYGDSSLWWVIAAASGVGWALQAPPGTVLRVPKNISQIYGLLA